MTSIGAAWIDGVRQLGGLLGVASASALDLGRRYAEPHRRYHTTAHVEAVLRDAAWLADELDLGPNERAAVTLAACAHDAVYDARPGEDERASADWARRHLDAAGLAEDTVRRVERLVLLTLSHNGDADDPAAAVLLDADLAILGADPDVYAEYVAAVRQEYAAVPDDQWRVGRADVLTALLARRPLFLTQPGRTRWAAAAWRNVELELAVLHSLS